MQDQPKTSPGKIFDYEKEGIFIEAGVRDSRGEKEPPGKVSGVVAMLGGTGLALNSIGNLSEVTTAQDAALTVSTLFIGGVLVRAGVRVPFWRQHIAESIRMEKSKVSDW